MTDQEAFDKVVRHLLKQMKRSVKHDAETGETICMYRGPRGLVCAVGCLIPDDEYSFLFENLLVDDIAQRVPSLARLNTDLLVALQAVHDGGRPSRWAGKLRVVARRFGLTMPDLEASNV